MGRLATDLTSVMRQSAASNSMWAWFSIQTLRILDMLSMDGTEFWHFPGSNDQN
jgi:hypothetical protein